MGKRRDPVRRIAGAVIALFPMMAAACELPPGVRLDSDHISLSYWTIPAKVAVGQPFVLEIAACPKTGVPVSERVKLDAHMPEHRHGMNYRIKVIPMSTGRFHSEGWLFHMPGRWEFRFDIGGELLSHSVRIE